MDILYIDRDRYIKYRYRHMLCKIYFTYIVSVNSNARVL